MIPTYLPYVYAPCRAGGEGGDFHDGDTCIYLQETVTPEEKSSSLYMSGA
jgi:hypothetical protein